MPNWCTNILKVREDIEKSGNELERFMECAKGKSDGDGEEVSFCFSSLVPRPENVDWYDWNIQNWGTKWDVTADIELDDEWFDEEEEGAVAIVRFDTAWSPPIEFIQKVAPMFPTLTFELCFWEGGMGFAGRFVKRGNKLLEDVSYSSSDKEYWEIATDGMSDEDVEERAKYYIEENALSYWTYSLDEILQIIGYENKNNFENLLLAKKVCGELKCSNEDELNGGEIADIVEKFVDERYFYDFIFNKYKKANKLRQYLQFLHHSIHLH